VYHHLFYGQPFDFSCKWAGSIPITADGTLNALRVITKNILAIVPETQSTIDWHNQYLVQPLEREISVNSGQKVMISFDYSAGAPLSEFRPVVTGPL